MSLLNKLKTAAAYLQSGKLKEAENIYDVLLAKYPYMPDALYGKYKINLVKNELLKAKDYLLQAIYSLSSSAKINENHKRIFIKWVNEFKKVFNENVFVELRESEYDKLIERLYLQGKYLELIQLKKPNQMSLKSLKYIVDAALKINFDVEKKIVYSLLFYTEDEETLYNIAKYFENRLIYNDAINIGLFLINKYNKNEYYSFVAKIYLNLMQFEMAEVYLKKSFFDFKDEMSGFILLSVYIKEAKFDEAENLIKILLQNEESCKSLILVTAEMLLNYCLDIDVKELDHPAKFLSLYKLKLILEGEDKAKEVLKVLNEKFPFIQRKSVYKNKYNLKKRLKNLENVVAFHTIGRGGSFFFHSLIDGHKEVATIPGVYFKGYFGLDVFDKLVNANKKDTIKRFLDVYEAVFDADSKKRVPGDPMGDGIQISEISGLTTLGENKDISLKIDTKKVEKILYKYLELFEKITAKDFFKIIHLVWEEIRFEFTNQEGNLERFLDNKKVLFYHIHNPNLLEYYKFIKVFPKAKDLVIIRNWLQGLESWLYSDYPKNKIQASYEIRINSFRDKYSRMFNKLLTRLFFQRVGYSLSNKTAFVKLEDVKNSPESTMKAVADWMGISYDECLLRPEFMGLKFHSNKSKLNPTISEFDKKSIKRKVGVLFSEKDARLLNTVLRPWNEVFEYGEGEFKYLDKDEALKLNEEIMDWERKLIDFFEIKEEDAMKVIKYRKEKLKLALNTEEQIFEELKKVELIKPRK